jgi:ribosome-binding protein aMBF1 (putative translation factor)
MEHQDWNVITFKKNKGPEKEIQAKSSVITATTSSTTNKPAWKIEQQVDGDNGKPLQYISKADSQLIIQGRIAMKLTQKDLACKLNIQIKDIQDIESGKALENKMVLSKIRKMLNLSTKN